MNLFFLDLDPVTSASYYFNKHCIKIILELAQLLYTSHWVLDTEYLTAECPYTPYKKTHTNHPLAVWTRESTANYRYVATMGLALCAEYSRRYNGKVHKTEMHLRWLQAHPPRTVSDPVYTSTVVCCDPVSVPPGCTPVPLCVPIYIIDLAKRQLVLAYRLYYLLEKQRLRDTPRQLTMLIDTWHVRGTIPMGILPIKN